VRRREFIALLGGTPFGWPLAVRAQQSTVPVIGYLSSRSPESETSYLAGFRQGLGNANYVENKNVVIEYRFSNSQYERNAPLAADLVRRQVAVMVSVGNSSAPLAAKEASSKIPIVFVVGADPVQSGLVNSLNRPGGNVTGVYSQSGELAAKNLGLMHELMPNAHTIAVLVNPKVNQAQLRDVRAAAATLGLELWVLDASTESEIEAAFATLAGQPADAMVVLVDPFFLTRAAKIADLAARLRVPAIYGRRPFAEAGGLISYSDDVADSYRQAGFYTGRILRGDKPADLPVLRPTKFELVINLKTAKALGLEIPPTLLALADKVIE
jgi:putative ABC transport system substrate-binding protein